MKFTFKRNNPVGRYRSFEMIQTDIKIKRKICGSINESTNGWKISIMVKGSPKHNPNCNWRHIIFKKRFETEKEARDFLNSEVCHSALEKYEIHFLE